MKKLLTSLVGATCALAMSSNAYANDDALCSLYSKTGGATVEFMLPLTMQQFVDMMAGKEPALMNQMTMKLLGEFNSDDLAALATVNQQDAEVIGEAAGMVAVELLMSGQATTKSDIVSVMNSGCNAIGAQTIINNQKAARNATQANMGQ